MTKAIDQDSEVNIFCFHSLKKSQKTKMSIVSFFFPPRFFLRKDGFWQLTSHVQWLTLIYRTIHLEKVLILFHSKSSWQVYVWVHAVGGFFMMSIRNHQFWWGKFNWENNFCTEALTLGSWNIVAFADLGFGLLWLLKCHFEASWKVTFSWEIW